MFQKYYKYKDNYYCLIHNKVKLKNPFTRSWHDAVTYFRLDNDKFIKGKGIYVETNLPNFCREESDFNRKFVEIKFVDDMGVEHP